MEGTNGKFKKIVWDLLEEADRLAASIYSRCEYPSRCVTYGFYDYIEAKTSPGADWEDLSMFICAKLIMWIFMGDERCPQDESLIRLLELLLIRIGGPNRILDLTIEGYTNWGPWAIEGKFG